jgi:hypothetical protein
MRLVRNIGYRVLLMILFMLLIAHYALPVSAHVDPEKENLLSFANIGDLYDDLGPIKMMMLMLTPKEQRAMYYHTVSIDASENCKSPNAWYFDGKVEDDICQEMKKQGYNVVCNTKCPVERQTGITCGLSHECCLPADEKPAEQSKPLRCQPSGEGRGIQYCTFF